MDTVTICKNFTKMSMTLRWPLAPTSVEITCVTRPKGHCIQVPWKYVKVCGYSGDLFFFSKTWTTGHWPLDDLWPQVCWGYMCDSTQGSLCPSPMKIQQSMWIQWTFSKTWTKGHWPLDDLVWLYPRTIVSKSHGNTSMYVDTVINFAKL